MRSKKIQNLLKMAVGEHGEINDEGPLTEGLYVDSDFLAFGIQYPIAFLNKFAKSQECGSEFKNIYFPYISFQL